MSKLAVVAILAAIPYLSGAGPEWARVQDLGAGRNVTVYTRDGKVWKGRLQSAGEGGLRLADRRRGGIEPSRDDIARVTRKSRPLGAFWGGIVSFGIAAPVGAYAGPYLTDWGNPSAGVRLRHAAGWGLFFGGIGAGIGALVGSESTLYRASDAGRARGRAE